MTLTPTPLPAWCRIVDEVIATVAKREGLSAKEVRGMLTEVDEKS